MTLALALHATFSITASQKSERAEIAEIRKKVVHGTDHSVS